MKTAGKNSRDIDDGLRRWWNALITSPVYQSDDLLLALGRPALDRLLHCIERKATLDLQQTEAQWRDWGDWRTLGVAVFAKADLGSVLDAMTARGWSDLLIAGCIGRVPDPRVVPYLLTKLASKEPRDRAAAVNDLAIQREPRATDALIRALRARSSDVRYLAVERLGELGDPGAVEPLRAFAKRSVRSPGLVRSAEAAIARIRRKRPA
jgi:HEAT repeat protein